MSEARFDSRHSGPKTHAVRHDTKHRKSCILFLDEKDIYQMISYADKQIGFVLYLPKY